MVTHINPQIAMITGMQTDGRVAFITMFDGISGRT